MPYAVDNDFFRTRAEEAADHREELRTELGLKSTPSVILPTVSNSNLSGRPRKGGRPILPKRIGVTDRK